MNFPVILLILAVAAIITFVTTSLIHWLPILLGIAVGLWAGKCLDSSD